MTATGAPGRRRSAASASLAALALLALLAGVPTILWTAAGAPWPDPSTSPQDVAHRLRQPLSDPLAVELLALLGWMCWATFAATVLREAAWYLRRLPHLRADRSLHAAHLETVSAPRLLVATCIGTLVLAALTPRTPTAIPSPELASATVATATSLEEVARASAEPESPVRHVVRPGDTLWNIAAHQLGDPIRWPEIYALSTPLTQPDGRKLTDPDLLTPGWHLHLPADARDHAVQTPPPDRAAAPPETTHDRSTARDEATDTSGTPRASTPEDRPVRITVGTASLIGITTAAGIAAAVTLARHRARRHAPPDLAAEPPNLSDAVRAATQAALAAQRADQDEADAHQADITRRPPPARPAPPGTVTCAHRDGTEIPLAALATPGGWNLTGPGAPAAARALAIAILSAAPRVSPRSPHVRLITTRDLADTLLPGLHPEVPGWYRAENTREALHTAQATTVERARASQDGRHPTPRLMDVLLDADLPTQAAATADHLVVLSLGGDQLANTARLAPDGTVEHASGPDHQLLARCGMFALAEAPARELIDALNPPTIAVPDQTAVQERPKTTAKPALTISLFGGLALHLHGEEVALTMKEAAKEFLAILAAHPNGLRTEALTDALRLSHDPERATRDLVNLRRAVRRTLRQVTGSRSAAFILHTTDRHRLDPQVVHSDVDTFTTAITTASRTKEPTARAAALHQALDVYHGPLCEGADYPWADEAREHYHHKAIDAAVFLTDHTTPEEALALLEQAATWEPTNETICQRLMRLHHDLGHPEAARHTYQRLTRHLAEIDATPTETTASLVCPERGMISSEELRIRTSSNGIRG
ncbi:BTAD domain-containing putative transcriptional regulator [Streptomyces radicis]|uniref:LysM peptidoglycan-binding domain-containing protein n=1 Tax=Streptomyces radicis TaxID=1750517 RepID=A0A3A9WUU8_9ACTN|nr:BTAD domain-containing putative transcriptional regulator [Streptomyces radicis]RKN11576.1 LysM peptidoglycan-binding domain-containing protein [Streptomyces radicis]RKN26406.1 LysM peptidoglycan-binding domain-containing protein [Streptomyces radicis]